MKAIYNYGRLTKDLVALQRRYPYIKCNVIGKSVLGRRIYELRIGTGEKIIHYNASFHANEWITSLVLMTWLWQLLEVEEPFNKVQLSIVPMVNPDGVELVCKGAQAAAGLYNVEEMNEYRADYCNWKANIRGVDLNKQFPANWESYKESVYCLAPYYRDYPGEAPLTEPEAIAMMELMKNNKIERMLALHTQGKEFYWGYEGYEAAEAQEIAQVFEKISGYKGIQYIDSHAGFRDWFIVEYQKPAFTLELGKGLNPLPLSHFHEIYRDTVPILNAAFKI
ncbi:MAG: M14 family metallocarboxypeptidase [Bacillus sp. (in: firmicutes)]